MDSKPFHVSVNIYMLLWSIVLSWALVLDSQETLFCCALCQALLGKGRDTYPITYTLKTLPLLPTQSLMKMLKGTELWL